MLSGSFVRFCSISAERLIAVGRPALGQEQRDAGPVGPGLVARGERPWTWSSLSRYSSTLSRRFWLRATVAASLERGRIGGLAFVVEGLADQRLGLLEVPEQTASTGPGSRSPDRRARPCRAASTAALA